MRVVMRAGFDRFSGYGNDAIDLAVNLEKAGVDVTPLPIDLLPGLPRSFTRLLEKDPRGKKDVLLQFTPPFDLKPWETEKMAAKRVGYTMWERTPLLVEDFAGHGWAPRDLTLADWDRLVVTCPMNREALAPFSRDTPVDVVPCGIEADDWPQARRDPQTPTRFLMIGMLAGRKNPFALLETWRDLKEAYSEFAEARLHVHTLAPGLHPAIADGAYGAGITFSNRPLSRDELIGLYHEHDVLVSTSRGEGNNKPAMEFMATGGTVIATDWSGHQNWLHRDVAYPVGGQMVACRHQPRAQEFEVDRGALAQALLQCATSKTEAVRKGEKAAGFVRASLAWPVVVDRLVKSLEAA